MKKLILKNKYVMLCLLFILQAFNNFTFAQASVRTNNANINGSNSAAFGFNALINNNNAGNSALGHSALHSNTNGHFCTALGKEALYNSDIAECTAVGFQALFANTTGGNNTAVGAGALSSITTGERNTGMGIDAGIIITTGDVNTCFGAYSNLSNATFTNASAIGANAIAGADDEVYLGDGAISVCEIWNAAGVMMLSDKRFKENINEENVKGLEFIMKLRPVDYNLNGRKLTEIKTKNMSAHLKQRYLNRDFSAGYNVRHCGLIAQEVEQAAQSCSFDFDAIAVAHKENEAYGLSYDAFVVPITKAVQEQQAVIEDLKRKIEKMTTGAVVMREKVFFDVVEHFRTAYGNVAEHRIYFGIYAKNGNLVRMENIVEQKTEITHLASLNDVDKMHYLALIVNNKIKALTVISK